MAVLYKVKRIDDHNELCYGQNISMVVCVERYGDIHQYVIKHLLRNEGGKINLTIKDRPIQSSDIKIETLGFAKRGLEVGVVILASASKR